MHTKGKWKIDKIISAGGAPIITSDTSWTGTPRQIAKVLYHNGSEDPEVQANAKLIADAPKTLQQRDDLLTIREVIQNESDKLDVRIAEGKHDDAWPNPEYIRDDDWARMMGERLVHHHVLRLFEQAIANAKKE